jgi:excisionase family DNA binding protein
MSALPRIRTLSGARGLPRLTPTPTDFEIQQARESSRKLAPALARCTDRKSSNDNEPIEIVLREKDGTESEFQIPLSALILFRRILTEMAEGNTVTLLPLHAQLTTQEAADLLGVSRPFVTKLIDGGEIPHRMVGTHRRVVLEDLMAYKKKTDEGRSAALDELVAQAQELDMGY